MIDMIIVWRSSPWEVISILSGFTKPKSVLGIMLAYQVA